MDAWCWYFVTWAHDQHFAANAFIHCLLKPPLKPQVGKAIGLFCAKCQDGKSSICASASQAAVLAKGLGTSGIGLGVTSVTGRCLESSTRDMVTRFSLLIWFGRIFAKKRQRNLNGSKQTNVAKGWWVFCFMCWFLTQEDAGCSTLSVKKHGCGRFAYPVKFSWLARLFATINSIGLFFMHFKCMKVPKYQWYALQFEQETYVQWMFTWLGVILFNHEHSRGFIMFQDA